MSSTLTPEQQEFIDAAQQLLLAAPHIVEIVGSIRHRMQTQKYKEAKIVLEQSTIVIPTFVKPEEKVLVCMAKFVVEKTKEATAEDEVVIAQVQKIIGDRLVYIGRMEDDGSFDVIFSNSVEGLDPVENRHETYINYKRNEIIPNWQIQTAGNNCFDFLLSGIKPHLPRK